MSELDPNLFTEQEIRFLTGQPSLGSRILRRVAWLCVASGVIGGAIGAAITLLLA
jgi:hypothetical protein